MTQVICDGCDDGPYTLQECDVCQGLYCVECFQDHEDLPEPYEDAYDNPKNPGARRWHSAGEP